MSCQSLVQSHTSSHHRHLVAIRLPQHLGKRERGDREEGREGSEGQKVREREETKREKGEVIFTLQRRVRVKVRLPCSSRSQRFPCSRRRRQWRDERYV